MDNIAKNYNPKEFEKKLYDYWMENDYFKAVVDKNKKPFTIIMPPPNVTGNLHIGHALNNTLQDIIIRRKRMMGYSALYLPGTDHASISTESRVVEKLRNEGKSKDDVGREGFLEETWKWTKKYGGNIKEQFKQLGVSCDWSRDRFTLDDDMSHAVEEVFIRLYNEGYIYRGDRIINWCPSCETAISDAEVEHIESDGKIWYLKYPIVGEENKFMIVATTRPETILGDLALAVNPEDERYKDYVGKKAILPIVNREIPIIADEYVESDFGSGVVKITPSHDANDFEVGERHNLGQCIIFDENAKINSNGKKFEGLDRYEARKAIIAEFENLGLLEKIEDHHNVIGHCERCGTVIEPIISKQWFVKMKEMAKLSLKYFEEDDSPNFVPKRFGKLYKNWLENLRDWCISRQLWWGHRLPVYYCEDCDEIYVGRENPNDLSEYKSHKWIQDEDTLDTWFSSALWPFSTLGWPNETEDYNYFYPTDVLVTSYDIIMFWVVRMVFSGLKQTGKMPFKHVLINGLVRDELGRKMSKSLGNGIDPLEIIDKYGADALRFTLVTGNSPGNDMRFYTDRVENSRNFANKLWNASRFIFMNYNENSKIKDISDISLKPEDEWILYRLNKTIKDIDYKMEQFDIGLAADDIYSFIWDYFCDWYIEMVKPRLYSSNIDENNEALSVLIYCLKKILKLLHPFMPFITEEIYQHIPGNDEALIVSAWPKVNDELGNEKTAKEVQLVMQLIKAIRTKRSEMNIANNRRTNTIIYTHDQFSKSAVENNLQHIKNLAYSDSVNIAKEKSNLNEDYITEVVEKCEIYLPLAELINISDEIARLEKEEKRLLSEIKRAESKLNNKGFVEKAPEKVVDMEREKKKSYEEMLKNTKERLEFLRGK
ncbi:MAG: valine--tRNA ligase [Tissierellia bacterium]|nr:valine--tRNA ligase [Tissierellia bacterium]